MTPRRRNALEDHGSHLVGGYRSEAVSKSSISRARAYRGMSEFWDTHDLGDYWARTKPAKFKVDIQTEVTYYPLDAALSLTLCAIAERRGVSAETLLNLWVQEKLREEPPVKSRSRFHGRSGR